MAVAAPVPKPREKSKDEKAFEGTWQVKGYEGGVPPPGDIRQMQFRFADGKWFVIADGKAGSLPACNYPQLRGRFRRFSWDFSRNMCIGRAFNSCRAPVQSHQSP